MDEKVVHNDAGDRGSANRPDPKQDLMGLYRALRYLEQDAQLAGLPLVSIIIGVAAQSTQDQIEGGGLDP